MTQVQMYNGEVTLSFNSGRHIYTWAEKGLPVRGVTTVLKWLAKPALIQWAANMASNYVLDELPPRAGQDEIDRVCKEAKTAHRRMSKGAADIGTAVHKFCEDYLTAAEDEKTIPVLPDDDAAVNACGAFMEWVGEHDIRPIALEHMLFSRKHYFAGTCDFYGHIDGELCVLDFKTSSGIYPEMILQVNGAYALALEEMYGERVNASWIVRLDKKTGKFETYRIPRSDEDQTAFRVLLEVDNHMKRLEGKMKEIKA